MRHYIIVGGRIYDDDIGAGKLKTALDNVRIEFVYVFYFARQNCKSYKNTGAASSFF